MRLRNFTRFFLFGTKTSLKCETWILTKIRLALASILGPFGVHLLKFTLTTPVHWCTIWGNSNFRLEFVTHTSQYTGVLPNLSRSLKTPGLPITSVTLSACSSFKAKDDWTFSRCFHRISFCSRVYIHVHGMHYLHHDVHELDGYDQEFWKTSGYSLKCVELVA